MSRAWLAPGPVSIAPVITTISGLQSAATAGTLTPGGFYLVTDWVSGTGSLPGPNKLLVQAINASTPSGFVQVETPIGFGGPTCGLMNWFSGTMVELEDGYGNRVTDGVPDVNQNIDSFPWAADNNWSNNTVLAEFQFTGGYAVTSAARSNGVQVQNCDLNSGNCDLTGATAGSMIDTTIAGGSVLVTGAGFIFVSGCQLIGGAFVGAGPGRLRLAATQLVAGNAQVTGSGGYLQMINCFAQNASVTVSSNAHLTLAGTYIISGATVTDSVASTGSGNSPQDQVMNCAINGGTVSFTGTATTSQTGRVMTSCEVGSGASATVNVDPTSSSGAALTNCVVQAGGTLNLDVDGQLFNCRVAANAVLTSGPYTSYSVIIDGAFSKTLTASNNNTLCNSLGSNVV